MPDTLTTDDRPTLWFDQTDDSDSGTDQTETESARFTIDSEKSANWLLGKLAAIEEEQARIKAQAKKRAEELEADRNRLLSRFGAELEAWAKGEAEARRRKSVTLLHGTLAFRSVPARWTVTDEDAALMACYDACPDAIVAKITLDKTALLAYVETTGEVLPGIERTEAGETFSVRFPKAGKGGEAESE
jgi:phage host-nuclease inhibitor protein Gam